MYTQEKERAIREKYYARGRGPDGRKIHSGKKRNWQVETMWELHHEIARRLVLGQKNVDIAAALNCTPQTISNVRNSPVVQEHMAMLKGSSDTDIIDIMQDIKNFAPECVSLLKEVVRGDGACEGASINLRAKTAEGMLDRGGSAAPKIVDLHHHMAKEDLDKILGVAESRRSIKKVTDGSVVEADYEEVSNA